MPNIRTPEGREELRRRLQLGHDCCLDQVHQRPEDSLLLNDALAGLDIAQEIAEAMRLIPHWRNSKALAEWDNWQKGSR